MTVRTKPAPVSKAARDICDSAAGRAGWPLEPRERSDFYHEPRVLPPEVAEWRHELVDRIIKKPAVFGCVRDNWSIRDARQVVDEGIAYIREVARILSLIYRRTGKDNSETLSIGSSTHALRVFH